MNIVQGKEMNPKIFAERLNQELDHMDFPTKMDERVDAFSKFMDIQRFKAESFLNGAAIPDAELLARLAEDLEVEVKWLTGESASP